MVDGTEMPQDRPLEEDEANKQLTLCRQGCVCLFTVDVSRRRRPSSRTDDFVRKRSSGWRRSSAIMRTWR